MFAHQLSNLGVWSRFNKAGGLLIPKVVLATHTATCPVSKGKAGGAKGGSKSGIKRALKSGKVRMAFIPEEWFTFFHSKTGVSGPYILGLVLTNYCVSKEIYVMEHEYYLGLSFLVVISVVNTKLGPALAATLDKDVDDIVNNMEVGRKQEIAMHESNIKGAKEAQWRAEGQKLLMDAKKENILMQLEAIYRERMMHVYKLVKGRMDYHVKRHQSEARIQQKWMIGWILEQVQKSITPEFQQQALAAAIQELAAVSSRAK